MRARHRLVVDLFVAVGVPRHCAELNSEVIEHHVPDDALAAFARFLKQCGGSHCSDTVETDRRGGSGRWQAVSFWK